MVGVMEPVVLDRRFRPWRYGVGHGQLLLHSPAEQNHGEHLDVLFEGVLAVKLRSSYRPLTLHPADPDIGAAILAFADVPARHRDRVLCLALPTPHAEPGFIACARATILATPAVHPAATRRNSPGTSPRHCWSRHGLAPSNPLPARS
jgi:hypothetical protein